jgi:hypothetical protein
MTFSFAVAIYYASPAPRWVVEGLLVSIAALLFALSFVRTLTLQIRSNGISYANLLRANSFVAFSEMSTVVFIDYRYSRSEYQPRRSLRSWTAIITPNPGLGRSSMKIPLSLFPEAAYVELNRVLKPEVWQPGS